MWELLILSVKLTLKWWPFFDSFFSHSRCHLLCTFPAFKKWDFILKLKLKSMCWVVINPWTCFTTELSGIEKITGYMIMKKSSFIVWWLVIELLIKLFKAHLPLNKIKQKNNYKPPSSLSGYKPTSRLSCSGSGADVSLNLCHAIC